MFVEGTNTDTTVFEGRSRIISDIINRHLALTKIKIPGVKKITISLTTEKDVNFIGAPMKGYSPVVNIRRTYDFNSFNSSSEENQNEMILSLIEYNINEAAKKFEWSIPNFTEIANEVRRVDFKQRYLEWRPKVSKDKKYKAGVEVEMLIDEARIFIVFFSQDDTLIKRVKLISVRADRFFIASLMGKAKWVTNTEFELVDKKNEIHFKASPLKDDAEVYFTPIDRDSNRVIDDLLILAASTSDEQALSILKEKFDKNT